MANPNPFLSGTGKSASNPFLSGTASSGANPFLKNVAKTTTAPAPSNNPWQPVLSFGQTLIDIASTPLYFVEGAISGAQKGKNPLESAVNNSIAWTQGKRPATGSDVLKNAGMSNDFWSSLAADIALDPLTYTPGVLVSAPLKAVLAATKYGVRSAGSALLKKEISATAAAITKAPIAGKAEKKLVTYTPAEKANITTDKLYQKTVGLEKTMDKFVFQPVKTEASRSASQALAQMIATGLEGAYKGAAMSIAKSGLKHSTTKLTKQGARAAKRGAAWEAPRFLEELAQATTKPEATGTAADVVSEAANASRINNIPVLDTAKQKVSKVSAVEAAAIQKPMTKVDAAALKKQLEKVDKVVQGIKVTNLDKENIAKKIGSFLDPARQNVYKFYADHVGKDSTIVRQLDYAIKLEDTNPLEVVARYVDSADPVRRQLAELMLGRVVSRSGATPVTIRELLTNSNYAGKYSELSQEIRDNLKNIFSDVAKMAKGGDKGITAVNKSNLSFLGEDVLNQLAKTGALDPAKKTNAAALQKVIDNLPATRTKGYANFEDFISGIKAEDNISKADLTKVLKLIDPEHALVTKIDNGVKSPVSSNALKAALTSDGVVTIERVRNNLSHLDTASFIDSTDIGLSDVAFVTQQEILYGTPAIDNLAAFETRQAAGEALVRLRSEGSGSAKVIDDAADSIGRGMKRRVGEIFTGTEKGFSRLGQYFTRAFREKGGTEAYLNEFFNQYVETDVLGSIFGKMTYREGIRKTADTRTPRQILGEVIFRTSSVDKILLSTYGVRVIHMRSAAKAGGKLENAYMHYVNFGDVAKTFNDAGEETANLFTKLLIPRVAVAGKINPAMDSLSFQTIGDTVATILEGLEKGTPVDPKELVAALKTPAPGKTWSKDFKAVVDENINDFVAFMTDTATAEKFAEIHKSKLKAEMLDLANPAQRFSSEMVDAMLKAYGAMQDAGITSAAERDKIVYDWMMKFAAVSDIFAFSNGEVAREAFRSTARMFLELSDSGVKGAAVTEWRQRIADFARANPNNSDVYAEFMNTFETYSKWEPTKTTQLATPVDASVADAANKAFVVAKDDFSKSVEKLNSGLSPAEVADWRKTHEEISAKLVESRKQLGKLGIEAQYWNGVTWVDGSRWNRSAAIKSLEKMPNRYIYTKSGIIDVAKYMLDSAAVVPTFNKFGTRHTAETRKIYEELASDLRTKIATNDKAQVIENTLKNLAEFDKMTPGNPEAVVERVDEEIFRNRFDAGTMTTEISTPPAGAMKADGVTPVPDFTIASTYRAAKTEEGLGRLQTLGQKMQLGAGFQRLAPLWTRVESTMYKAVSDTAEVTRWAFKEFRANGLKTEDMDLAISSAMNKVPLDETANKAIANIAQTFGGVIDSVIKHAIERGLHPKYIEQAFKQQGIDRFIPDWSAFDKPSDIVKIIGYLPIGDGPAHVIAQLEDADPFVKQAANFALQQWKETKDAFISEAAKRGDTTASIGLFHKAVSGIQHASSEATLASMLIEDFNFKAYYPGMSEAAAYKAAVESGDFVRVRTDSRGFSLTKWFPETAEKGNLFHKDIAKQIGALERNYNYTMENHMGKFLRNSMAILGVFKTTQTVLRPGHLVNTAVGDSITSLMRGTNPLLFKDAARIAMKFAGTKVQADWIASESGKRMALLNDSLAGLTKREIKEAEEGMTVVFNNKKTKLSDEEATSLLRDASALLGNVSATDELMQWTELENFANGTDSGLAYQKAMLERMNAKQIGARARRAWLTGTKPAGDAVAYVGNIPRVATALDVLKKGNFKNREAAVQAIANELRIYHPTITSLSAFERQKIRPWFSYYTWIRGAHVAFLKMASEHTAAMLIPSKYFYNQALANEMGPASIGNLWGEKTETPTYLNYSTYGPTSQGPRGGLIYRPSILPLDVLDSWNLQNDTTKAVDKQFFDNLRSVGQNTIGRNLNQVLTPGAEWLLGTDLETGKPSTIKDLKSATDSLVGNIGTIQLLQGLGAYTPANKGPESLTPMTERDRQLKVLNYLFGMRLSDVNTSANLFNANKDLMARLGRIDEANITK